MDRQRLGTCNDPMVPAKLDDDLVSSFFDWNLVNRVTLDDTSLGQNLDNFASVPPDPNPTYITQPFRANVEGDFHEDCDFSDLVLKYINQMLMEEDIEEKACMFEESAALQAAEKSFYEVLREKNPPSSNNHPNSSLDQNAESLYKSHDGNYHIYSSSSCLPGAELSCLSDHESSSLLSVTKDLASRSISQPSISSSSSSSNAIDGLAESPVSTLWVPDIFTDSQSLMHYRQGVEEASKFLPIGNGLLVNVGDDRLLPKEQKEETEGVVVKVEKKYDRQYSPDGLRGKKNPYTENLNFDEGRSNKQSAVYSDSTVGSDMFDKVLLCDGGRGESAIREALQSGATKNMQQNAQSKGSNGGKARRKKQGRKKDVVDLRTTLTLCAQAVATNDQRSANELLKQIRQHSSPTGDGMQRLAHYFASGLEARMAGYGTQIFKAFISMPSAADVLKAYHLFLAVSPFRKFSNFFSNKTIMNAAENKTRLHIIDLGILYGFQWPCLIQRLSARTGGPPKLRITGIDFPCPGFRPSERVEETGHRLARYAEKFNVPFEFNAIAQKWETIKIEDLKIDSEELLVVNCFYRLRNLLDETVVVESPRNIVLNLIRQMNPDIFIQGIVNGSYNAPFFISRFREALFHFSSLFDMLEAIVPREYHERMLIEKNIFGKEAMNVIACEGAERIERPETYKQWQVRNLRAGFKQLPLNQEILDMAKDRLKSYHKDFVIDEDGQWMLQGWKGRIEYALSTWRPAN
ncbi:hypothetical protein RJ639_017845 [Escallonia herrerae]|uniref:Scarecrow-like protein 14 n=1 Tax=Escallonia herrerae TaxID=1293975 RepID=A0AA88VAL2_9ASTE|nr:hypothetical protein RJ639_017845 [Escallonia herrerae]